MRPIDRILQIGRTGELPDAELELARLHEPNAPSQIPENRGGRDAQIFDAMLSGAVPIEEGMRRIAHQGGWPIRTGRELIFAFVSDDGPWRLATEASGWSPAAMQSQGNLHFMRVQGDPEGRYKFVSREGRWIADPNSRQYGYDDHGEYSSIRAPDGPHLERWPMMGTSELVDRTVRVWVPSKKPTHHIYAQDGQNLFDPNGPYGGWKLQHAVGPSTLVAAVDCTGQREHEYIGKLRDAYADFVAVDIQRFIEERYGQPRKRAIMGSSYAALASVHTAMRHPSNYDFVISMSGSYGAADIGIGKLRRTKLYFDSGGGPAGGDNYRGNLRTAEAFAKAGYRFDKDLWYHHEPGAGHNEEFWAKRVWRPIELFERM